jgi:hypothetical protein
MKDSEVRSPVSFEVHVARLPQKGLPVVVDADEAQRRALAAAHGLFSVESYRAEMLVTAWKRSGVKVSGRVVADITQSCVVTLQPVAAHIDEAVEGVFLPQDSKLARFDQNGEMLLDAEGPDSPRCSPATPSTLVRWRRNFSASPSIPIRARPAPLSTPPRWTDRRKTSSRKNCAAFSEKSESRAISQKPVVRRSKTAIFAGISASRQTSSEIKTA